MEQSGLEKVYNNLYGAVYQCSRKNCFFLEFDKKVIRFKVADFLQFKKEVDGLDISSLINDISRAADVTVLMPFRCQRCFVLSPLEVYYLQELLQGAQFVLELNSLLHECLFTPRTKQFV